MPLKQSAVLGDPPANSLAPHPKTGGLQLPTHDLDHLFFHETSAFLDLLERRAILPRVTNDEGDLFWRIRRFHGG